MSSVQSREGTTLLQKGAAFLADRDLSAAVEAYEKARDLCADETECHLGLGRALSGLGRFKEAFQSLSQAAQMAPEDPRTHYYLASHLLNSGQPEMALPMFRRLEERHPGYRDVAERFRHCLVRVRFLPPIDLEPDLIALLESGDFTDIAAAPVVAMVLVKKYRVGRHTASDAEWCAAFETDRLLALLLTRCFNVNVALERILLRIRRFLFFGNLPDWSSPARRAFCVRLAIAHFNSDYAGPWDAAERELLEKRLCALEGTDDGDSQSGLDLARTLVGIAMYRQPPREAMVRLAAANLDDPHVRSFLTYLHFDLVALEGETVARLGDVRDPISRRVQTQYERFPFPRWRDIHTSRRIGFAESMRRRFPHTRDLAFPDRPDILVAGCGSGRHPIELAEKFHYRSMVGLDLSKASLAYAQQRARERGCERLEFLHADILNLRGWERRFDVIEAVGVVHHAQDPLEAWGILRSLLRPGGWMKIAVYSRMARRDITRVRDWIHEQGYAATEDGMLAFRADYLAGKVPSSFSFLEEITDFYNLNHLRDLLFHEYEHLFDLDRIEQGLHTLDLTFTGFLFKRLDILLRYRRRFPEDITASNLNHWRRFESEFPDSFLEMYCFWCRG